jgi:hypothetical protein
MNCQHCGHEMQTVFNQPLNVNGCAQPSTQYAVVVNPSVAQPSPSVMLADVRLLTTCMGANPQASTFIKF